MFVLIKIGISEGVIPEISEAFRHLGQKPGMFIENETHVQRCI